MSDNKNAPITIEILEKAKEQTLLNYRYKQIMEEIDTLLHQLTTRGVFTEEFAKKLHSHIYLPMKEPDSQIIWESSIELAQLYALQKATKE